MVLGAIVGWGILSPYAKHKGWAPGPVDDWTTGSRGWIIWVSLASLLADASVKLVWLLIQVLSKRFLANGHQSGHLDAFWKTHVRPRLPGYRPEEYHPVAREPSQQSESDQEDTDLTEEIRLIRTGQSDLLPAEEEPVDGGVVIPKVLGVGFLLSLVICTLAVHVIFGNIIPWYFTLLAIALSLPMAVVGIRSIGETDYNPESAIRTYPLALLLQELALPKLVISLVPTDDSLLLTCSH